MSHEVEEEDLWGMWNWERQKHILGISEMVVARLFPGIREDVREERV